MDPTARGHRDTLDVPFAKLVSRAPEVPQVELTSLLVNKLYQM